MRRLITLLIVLMAGLIAGLLISPALKAYSATRVQCVAVPDGSVHLCEYHPRVGTGEAPYIMVTEYMNWLTWGGQLGDIPIQETYVKHPAVVENGRRVIAFSDNRTIADSAWLANFPNNTLPPTECALNGQISSCTAVEQKTALDFEHSIIVNDVDYPL